ncbi:hypothetical protein ARAM_003428 [Aspergillus rambellii]|uniref:Uncharacterized protein n=1 Tax=Aspergillus rambellii TaxID=308745 RepID=A0A0F8X2P3_9EURO|nr:hypothetical protein ARAM_003428 [Aspergillus rambellii]
MASKDPSDYLDYQIEHSLNSKDTIEQTPRQISLRLMVLNFATIFPASAMMTNVLLDLASQDRGASYIPSLREEIHRVGAIENQVWNERALDKLHRMDGVIKESFRMCGPLCYALPRKVSVLFGNPTPTNQIVMWKIRFSRQKGCDLRTTQSSLGELL